MSEADERGVRTAAVVGAVGGAGATRLAVELGAALARDGRRVAVLDADFGTVGLGAYVPGRVGGGVTDLLGGDGAVRETLSPVEGVLDDRSADDGTGGPGGEVGPTPGVAVAPAAAPFGDLAEAKATEHARYLPSVVDRVLRDGHDHVLLDAGPVLDNPSVAAVDAADRTALVAPATDRGADGVQRVRGRMADVDAGDADVVVTNRADGPGPTDADVVVPESDAVAAADAPVAGREAGAFPAAVADCAEELFGTDLDAEYEGGGFLGRVGD